MTPQQQTRITLEKAPDYREGYANSVQIANFQGVYISPQQAKALLNVLQQNIGQYEAAFGEIRLEPRAGAGFVQ